MRQAKDKANTKTPCWDSEDKTERLQSRSTGKQVETELKYEHSITLAWSEEGEHETTDNNHSADIERDFGAIQPTSNPLTQTDPTHFTIRKLSP